MEKSPNAYHTMAKAIGILVMVSIFSMIWRAGIIVFVPIYWISKSAVVIALSILLIGMIAGLLPHEREFKAVIKRYRFALALLITPFIGIAGSSLLGFGWGAYFPLVRFEYIRILFMFFLFFITVYSAMESKLFIKIIFATIAASCIPLWLSLNSTGKLFSLEAGRLTGTGNDSNFLAAWIIVALAGATIFFLWERRAIRWVWLAGIFVITPLLIWTVSRAAWLTAILAACIILTLFFKNGCSKERARRSGILIATIVASLMCGFLLFPPLSRVVITIRALAPLISHERLVRVIRLAAPPNTIRKEDFPKAGDGFGIADELRVTINNNRGWLWREGAQRLIQTPLGFGPAYYFWNPIGIEGLWMQHKLNAHNVWLDIGLSNGWLGLALWLLFVYRVIGDAFRSQYRENPECFAIVVSLFALLFLGTFMDMFTQPIVWIIFGLAAASARKTPTTTITTP